MRALRPPSRAPTCRLPRRSARLPTSGSSADAAIATASAPSRREPQPSRAEPLPSKRRAASRAPRRDLRAHDVNRELTACGEGQLRASRRLMQCTQLRETAEHGRRAHVARCSRRREREFSRQDRGEMRAPRPRGRAPTCRPPRRSARLPSSRPSTRGDRHGLRTVAARATAIARRASPLEAGVLLRVLLEQTRELAARDVNRELTTCGHGAPRAATPHAMRAVARGRRARSPSTRRALFATT